MRRLSVQASAVILLGALATSTPARANWSANGVELSAGSHISDPGVIVSDGLGGAIAWYHVYAGGASSIYNVKRLTAEGTALPGWGAYWNGISGIAPDGAGGLYRAHTINVSTTQKYDAFLVHTLPDGSQDPVWPGGLNGLGVGVTTAYEFAPAVVGDGAGGAICVYVYGSFDHLIAKRVNSNGTFAAGWPAAGVTLYAGSDGPLGGTPATLFPDGQGGAYAAWLSSEIRLQRVTGGGAIAAGWPADGLVASINPVGTTITFLGMIPSGPDHVILAWLDSEPSRKGFWFQRVHRDGTLADGWPAAGVRFITPSLILAIGPMVPDGAEGLYLSWWDGSTLRITRLNSAGTVVAPWAAGGSDLRDLAEGGAVLAGGGTIAPGPNGGLIACWKDGRFPGAARWRARWLLSDGSPDPTQPDTSRILTPPGVTVLSLSGAASDGNGGLYYLWQEDTGFLWYFVKIGWAPYPQTTLAVPAPPRTAALSLGPPFPNPAGHELRVSFSLGDSGPARLELLDVAGRRVRAMEVAGGGQHVERFDRLGELPAGVYLLRLAQGASVRLARVAILR